MKIELKDGIYVPLDERPEDILVFVDESYMAEQTGIIQSAVTVLSGHYQRELRPKHRQLLTSLDPNAKEFKGSSLSYGNREKYTKFIRLFVNTTAALSDQSTIRSAIAIDAMEPYRTSEDIKWIVNQTEGAFKNVNVTPTPHLCSDFARQVLWLAKHLPNIVPKKYKNELVIVFDDHHDLANAVRELQPVKIQTEVFLRETWKNLSAFANVFLQKMCPNRRFPHIRQMITSWSPKEAGLQAADVITNLAHGAIRYEMGIVDDKTKLRHEVMQEFIPSSLIPEELKKHIRIKGAEIECINPGLISRHTLEP